MADILKKNASKPEQKAIIKRKKEISALRQHWVETT